MNKKLLKNYTINNNSGIVGLVLVFVIFLVLLTLAVSMSPLKSYLSGIPGQPSKVEAVTTTTFTPTIVPVSDPEIPNPWRGSYEWYNLDPQPAGWPVMDTYVRFPWRYLPTCDCGFESAQGVYHWDRFDAELAKAQAKGGKFGTRVIAVSSFDGGTWTPQYIMDNTNGTTYQGLYIPEWNNPFFIQRAQALVSAIAARYGNDPRFGFIDIGFVGDFGEWHCYGFPEANGGSACNMTMTNKQAIIDAHINAFTNPNQRVVMMSDDTAALDYALNQSPRVGWRRDSLGSTHFSVDLVLSTVGQERWKNAPVITEFFGSLGNGMMTKALQDTKNYHIGMIGNGNFGNLNRLNPQEKKNFELANKTAGYRFELNKLIITNPIATGSAFTITSDWSNQGVTPAYSPWNVTFELRDPSGNLVVWEGASSANLETLLPTSGTPVTINDTFSLPATVVDGFYDLYVKVLDPETYYSPLRLAISGRNADGSYKLGSVTVGNPGPTPTPSVITGIITGIVYSSAGGTISGAKVSLVVNGTTKTYNTDALGNYTIPDLPVGTYSVTYSAPGYTTQTVSVAVTAGSTTTQNVTLTSRR